MGEEDEGSWSGEGIRGEMVMMAGSRGVIGAFNVALFFCVGLVERGHRPACRAIKVAVFNEERD